MSNFWDSIFQPPTPGQTLPSPLNDIYRNIVLNPELIDQAAEIVHPSLSPDPNSPNSLIALVGKPEGFDTPPADLSPDIFASWHSAFQAEYINSYPTDAHGVIEIGANLGEPIHVTLSSDQKKVFILETLEVADFAMMAIADQIRIAQTQTFINDLSLRLGLSSTYDTTSPDSLMQKTKDLIDIDDIHTDANSHFVSPEDKQVFLDQLKNIEIRLAQQGVFAEREINAAIKAIEERFIRAAAFAKAAAISETNSSFNRVPTEEHPDLHPITQFDNVISSDSGAAIRSGLQNLMNAERQIAEADKASLQLATGSLQGVTKHLDLPTMLAAFEMNANLKLQALSAVLTEVIRQINELLKTFNAMQDLINQTIQTFDVTDAEEERGLLGYQNNVSEVDNNSERKFEDPRHVDLDRLVIGGEGLEQEGPGGPFTPPALSPEQLRVISMFEQQLGAPNSALHPLEELFGITRPTADFYDNVGCTLNYFQKNFYDQFAARLGQAVQQISEQNQLIFNEISTQQKEQTNHFQNATDALAKAQDIASTISRNIG